MTLGDERGAARCGEPFEYVWYGTDAVNETRTEKFGNEKENGEPGAVLVRNSIKLQATCTSGDAGKRAGPCFRGDDRGEGGGRGLLASIEKRAGKVYYQPRNMAMLYVTMRVSRASGCPKTHGERRVMIFAQTSCPCRDIGCRLATAKTIVPGQSPSSQRGLEPC